MVMVIQTMGAFFAVASFTRILELPRRFLMWYGTAGALCWLVYLNVRDGAGSKILAAFAAGLAVAVFSHLAARLLKAPPGYPRRSDGLTGWICPRWCSPRWPR